MNVNQKRNLEYNQMKKAIENLQYLIMTMLIAGQVVVGQNYVVGQAIYLIADIISLWRCFALRRPLADKVKEIAFVGITTALLVVNIIKNL